MHGLISSHVIANIVADVATWPSLPAIVVEKSPRCKIGSMPCFLDLIINQRAQFHCPHAEYEFISQTTPFRDDFSNQNRWRNSLRQLQSNRSRYQRESLAANTSLLTNSARHVDPSSVNADVNACGMLIHPFFTRTTPRTTISSRYLATDKITKSQDPQNMLLVLDQ
jgi:hypothetical protein